jgi:hypothetical protein
MYDYPIEMFDGTGKPIDGPLSTDRPHQIKLGGAYQFSFGTSVGANSWIFSGIPISRSIAVISGHNYPMYYLGRGSEGRTPVYSQTDLFVQHAFRVGGNRQLQLQFNVLNLFDQRTVLDRFTTMRRAGSGISINEAALYAGQVNVQSLIDAQAAAGNTFLDPRFLKDSAYLNQRQARFSVRYTF